MKQIKVKKKSKKIIDTSYLACAHHSAMIGSLGFFSDKMNSSSSTNIRCLIVGLGGGALAGYISQQFPSSILDVVELDPSIVRVAIEHFGFKANERLNVITCDGLSYIKERSHKTENAENDQLYDIIMFDVDSKDSRIGMSCPPKPFVEPDFLRCVSNCMSEEGIFVLNITCRDPTLRLEVLSDVKNIFNNVLSYQIPQEVNEIFLCWKNCVSDINSKVTKNHPVIKAFLSVNDILKDDLLDIKEAMEQIKLT